MRGVCAYRKTALISLLLTAFLDTFLASGEHVVDVDQRKHDESSDKRAGLDGDAAPQQGGVTRLVKQRTNHHLQIGKGTSENNPGDDL